jgi:arylsulfatase
VHEGGIATPFIVHWPRGIAARNELRHNPAHLIDVVPTLLEITGARKPEHWNGARIPQSPGKSLLPAFARDSTVEHEYLWWLHEGNRAIRIGDWKLVAARDEGWQLFDLRRDRSESHDLAAERPDQVRTLAEQWNRHLEEFRILAEPTATAAKGKQSGKGKGKAKEKAKEKLKQP